jgi:hypothetical protein
VLNHFLVGNSHQIEFRRSEKSKFWDFQNASILIEVESAGRAAMVCHKECICDGTCITVGIAGSLAWISRGSLDYAS